MLALHSQSLTAARQWRATNTIPPEVLTRVHERPTVAREVLPLHRRELNLIRSHVRITDLFDAVAVGLFHAVTVVAALPPTHVYDLAPAERDSDLREQRLRHIRTPPPHVQVIAGRAWVDLDAVDGAQVITLAIEDLEEACDLRPSHCPLTGHLSQHRVPRRSHVTDRQPPQPRVRQQAVRAGVRPAGHVPEVDPTVKVDVSPAVTTRAHRRADGPHDDSRPIRTQVVANRRPLRTSEGPLRGPAPGRRALIVTTA